MVEGQGGLGRVTYYNPSAGLSWSVGTEPEAPISVLLVFHLYAGDSDNSHQRWVQLGVPWFPFPDFPSHSLALPTQAAGKVGQECLGPGPWPES